MRAGSTDSFSDLASESAAEVVRRRLRSRAGLDRYDYAQGTSGTSSNSGSGRTGGLLLTVARSRACAGREETSSSQPAPVNHAHARNVYNVGICSIWLCSVRLARA